VNDYLEEDKVYFRSLLLVSGVTLLAYGVYGYLAFRVPSEVYFLKFLGNSQGSYPDFFEVWP
jgi:hypothetical protein